MSVRRARGLSGTIGVTFLGAVVPGAGFWWTGRRLLGALVAVVALAGAGAAYWFSGRDLRTALEFAFDPARLKVAAAILIAAFAVWVVVVVAQFLLVRPKERTRGETVGGTAFVLVLVLALAAPVALASRYATVQADLITTIFDDNQSATTPTTVTAEDPWGGQDRVNVLLLGGDGGVGRIGVRTDTIILVSMNTRTGKTVLFSLPRNLQYAPFPEDSPLHALYPSGFTGEGDAGNWLLNAIYPEVPLLHPGILGRSDNEGADALKQAVSATLGVPVDYYLLVNLDGFREIVAAMGGVTVNINQPIPIGGDSDAGIPPTDYLQPGPNQHLNGFEALWYSRGRYGLDDYQRMERQRCMIDALIEEANPLNLLRRYQALAAVGKEIVFSDVPSKLLPAFVELTLKVKEHRVKSVVFRLSEEFFPGNPDIEWLHESVARAIAVSDDPSLRNRGEAKPGDAVDVKDSCAYAPVS